jgi:hypothetical protein
MQMVSWFPRGHRVEAATVLYGRCLEIEQFKQVERLLNDHEIHELRCVEGGGGRVLLRIVNARMLSEVALSRLCECLAHLCAAAAAAATPLQGYGWEP